MLNTSTEVDSSVQYIDKEFEEAKVEDQSFRDQVESVMHQADCSYRKAIIYVLKNKQRNLQKI